jgi:hypothetical protein
MVGLSNVDNTTDLNKPISNSTQTALNLKANSNTSPTITLGGDLTGNVTLSNLGSATLTATIAANSVALGTDTTGDFISSLVAGTGITLENNSGEGSTPTISVDTSTIATKTYVDNTAAGIVAKPSVLGATVSSVTGTYYNGPNDDGVGATLTHDSNGAFPSTAGGATGWAVGKGILLKNQTDKKQNGRYFVSNMGSVSTPYVLTRCGYCDEADEIPGAYIFVQDGTHAGTGWIQVVADPATFVVGTDDIDVFQFSGAGTYLGGNGLVLTDNTFSVGTASTDRIVVNADDIDLASGIATIGTYQSVTVDTYGRVTAGTNPTTLSGYGITDAAPINNASFTGTFSAPSGTITSTMIADGTIVNGDIDSSAAIAHSKLANATAGQILLGTTTTGVVTATTLSGDVTVTGAGVTAIGSGKVTSTMILDGTIVNGDINASAAIDLSKLASGTSAQVIVANGSGVPTYVTLSGDVTISNTGVASIQADSVALGTDTTGSYVASLVAGTGITLSNNSGESATPTVAVTANTYDAYGSARNLEIKFLMEVM